MQITYEGKPDENQSHSEPEGWGRHIKRSWSLTGEIMITGTLNFTKASEEKNAENLLVIHDTKLAERYVENWKEHERHSEVYVGRLR